MATVSQDECAQDFAMSTTDGCRRSALHNVHCNED